MRSADLAPALRGGRLSRVAPFVVAALSLLATAPLFDGRLVNGHDSLEHAMRTAEFARALGSGTWWPRWAPSLGGGYGEPVFLFNPPLFYFVAAPQVLAGVPIAWALNLACALLILVGGLGVYTWAARPFGRIGGFVAAVAYVWAPYVLLDLYVRQALTELATLCALPWALWGLSRTCSAPGGRRLAAAGLAVGAVLLGSTPATLVAAPALLGQVLVLADRRRPAGTARGLAALALGAMLAGAFWVPAVTERSLMRFDRLLVGPPAYQNHFVEPWQLLSSGWGYGISTAGPRDGMGFGLGEAHLVLAAAGLIVLAAGRVRGLARRQLWLAVGLVALGAGLSIEPSGPLWAAVPPLHYLQFPWRFLLLACLGSAVLAAAPAAALIRRDARWGAVLAVACAGALVAASWGRARPGSLVSAPDDQLASAAIARRDRGQGTAREYETIWAEGRPEKPPTARLIVRSGSAAIAEQEVAAHTQRFVVDARARSALRLNTFYFPGWQVFVDGQERPVDYANPSGLIEFSVDRGEHVVEARFGSTPARLAGVALSLVGLAALVLLGLPSRLAAARRPARTLNANAVRRAPPLERATAAPFEADSSHRRPI